MNNRMSDKENMIYLNSFKLFFLDELYFYWQLSPTNIIYKNIESFFECSFKKISKLISNTNMSLSMMTKIVKMYAVILNIRIESIVSRKDDVFKVFFLKKIIS